MVLPECDRDDFVCEGGEGGWGVEGVVGGGWAEAGLRPDELKEKGVG